MKKQLLLINIWVLFFFILDRILKKVALSGATEEFLFLRFSLFRNPNIALSIPLKGFIFYFLLIIILAWVVSGIIRSYQSVRIARIFGFSLILAGAFSNILDRWQSGAVIDYFDLPLLTIFNLADLMILAGVIILIWQLIFDKNALPR